VPNAKAMLDAGFTTVRNLGSGEYADVALKQGIEGGFFPGRGSCPPPTASERLAAIAAGERLAAEPQQGGGARGQRAGRGADHDPREPEVRRGSDQGLRDRRRLLPQHRSGRSADERGGASRGGRRGAYAGHEGRGACAWRSGIKAALRAGIDTIEHASLVDDEGIRLAKEKGAFFSMDIFNTEYTQSEGKKNGVDEENLQKDRDVADIQRNNFRKAHQRA
jgi:hypothetical protein